MVRKDGESMEFYVALEDEDGGYNREAFLLGCVISLFSVSVGTGPKPNEMGCIVQLFL